MRNQYNEQLNILNDELTAMGALCESAIAKAMKALATGDMELVAKTNEAEKKIDDKERTIEAMCVKLILGQQPVAHDLMFISAALKMITDMERIGDQAADIAEFADEIKLSEDEQNANISEMAHQVIKMVTDSVEAFVNRDMDGASMVKESDNAVDDLFDKIKAELAGKVTSREKTIEEALDILMIIKYLERIGDHAVNIAEWVEFAMTGKHDLKED